MNKQSNWISGINSWRFILAIWVLLGHHNIFKETIIFLFGNTSELSKILIGISANFFVGVAAVIAFFVISGIVIHFPYQKDKPLDLTNFYLKRYIRVGVPMVIIIVFCELIDFENPVLWSLYCELIYYTIYPLILFFIRKMGINIIILFSYVLYIILLIYDDFTFQSLLYQWNEQEGYHGNYHYHGIYLTWIIGLPCWLLGVKTAHNCSKENKPQISKNKIIIIRLFLLIISILCSIARFHFSLSYTLSLNVFTFLVFYWINSEIAYFKTNSPNKIIENAGNWSYSLYLCHMPIFFLFHNLYSGNSSVFISLLEVVLGLLISYIFYLIVERPTHKFARKVRVNPLFI